MMTFFFFSFFWVVELFFFFFLVYKLGCITKNKKEGMVYDAKCLVSDKNQFYYCNSRQLRDEELLTCI